MTRDIKYGVLYVALCASLQVLVFAAIYFGREYEIKTYPRYLLPFACIMPVFAATWFTKAMIADTPSTLSRKEFMIFLL